MSNNSIFSYDNTLPGVITEIDSHLSSDYDTSLFGTTDSIVVVGTAFDGPVGVVTPVYSVEHAMYIFGKTYDSKTRREASLVTGVQDAWNHGCRTIYAMRINGKDLYKDFDLRVNNGYKLRVKSRYPSNLGKQVYIKYDDTDNLETMTIYKPASRATVKEKLNGLVESDNSVMVNTLYIAQDYSFTKESKLVDVISIFNEHVYNNVVELEIVDEDGNIVTDSSEAYEVTLGAVYPGTYFIGRKDSLCEKITKLTTNVVLDETDPVPYGGFDGKYFYTLEMNTDVTQNLPITYTSLKDMRAILDRVGITMDEADDYLEDAEVSNLAFPEDDIDYEETNMTAFEKYQRLGSGYAITAVAERRVGADDQELIPKVKEAPLNDKQRIVPTGDGIYSILEDTKIKYHVLAHDICADTVIGGKIPKHTAFKTTLPGNFELVNGLISATRVIASDNEYPSQSYNFMIYNMEEKPVITKDNLYTDRIVEIIGFAEDASVVKNAKGVKPGSKCLEILEDGCTLYIADENGVYKATQDKKYAGDKAEGALYLAGWKPYTCKYAENKLVFTAIEDGKTETGGKPYVLMQDGTNLFVTSMDDYTEKLPFMATAEVALHTENDEDLFIYFQDHATGNNHIMISYPYFATTTLSDVVDLLNASALGKEFTFELTAQGRLLKDEYFTDADKQVAAEKSVQPVLTPGQMQYVASDRQRSYDYSLHIPYYTTDNFARHLAQHCVYTELKTSPAHGVIGCERVTDVSKPSLAKKIADLKAFNWSMYVKTDYGKNMLTADNTPYSIGRAVSTTLFQEPIVTVSNYTTLVNGSTAYAGFISSLKVGQSPTGQTIDVTPSYEFSRSQLQSLTDMGFVTVKNSFTKGYIVTDGVTMAPNDDLLRRLFNTRVMHFVEDVIRAASEPFIGKANTLTNRNSLQTAINSKLTPLMDTLLRSFEFKIVDDGSIDQYTYIDIQYTIVPVNEIREIRNYIRVKN